MTTNINNFGSFGYEFGKSIANEALTAVPMLFATSISSRLGLGNSFNNGMSLIAGASLLRQCLKLPKLLRDDKQLDFVSKFCNASVGAALISSTLFPNNFTTHAVNLGLLLLGVETHVKAVYGIGKEVLRSKQKNWGKIAGKILSLVVIRPLINNFRTQYHTFPAATIRSHLSKKFSKEPEALALIFKIKTADGQQLFKNYQEFNDSLFPEILYHSPDFDNLLHPLNEICEKASIYTREQINFAFRIAAEENFSSLYSKSLAKLTDLLKNRLPENPLILQASEDWTGFALDFEKNGIRKVSTAADICGTLKDAATKAGSKLVDFLRIEGHGTPNNIALSNFEYIGNDNIKALAQCVKKYTTEDSTVVLKSCSTGKPLENESLNIAQKLSLWSQRRVLAPISSISTGRCLTNYDGETRRADFSCYQNWIDKYTSTFLWETYSSKNIITEYNNKDLD